MTMEELVATLEAIKDNKEVLIPYQLHSAGQIQNIIESIGGINAAVEFFHAIMNSEPPTIGAIKP